MKTDRELLEAAAKAAGLDVDLERQDPELGIAFRGTATWWNPRTDDGDSFRLAVQLNIQVSQREKYKRSRAELGNCTSSWPWGNDKMAATRMAILDTAAYPQPPKDTP